MKESKRGIVMDRFLIILSVCACLVINVNAQTTASPLECNSNPCQNGGTCVDGEGYYSGYICQCAEEFWGNNCEERAGSRNGICPDGNIFEADQVREIIPFQDSYACYYLIAIPNVPRIDIVFDYFNVEARKDEVAIGPGLLVDERRTLTTTYVLDNDVNPLNHSSFTDGTVSVVGSTAWMEIFTDKNIVSPGVRFTILADAIDCISDPCQNGATCNDLYNRYECVCTQGYTGPNCETELDFCSSVPCENGGTCTADTFGYTCACPPGWTGVNCEMNINECASTPCLNGGLCIDGINEWTCQCTGQWTGDRCQISLNPCGSFPCVNGGTCVNAGDDFVCECPTGFVGDLCEIDVNECSSLPCQNGATCIDGPGWYTCQCRYGFSGTNCEDVGYCDMEGVWYNECNDRVTISLTSTGMILGDYASNVELLTGYAAPTVVVGYANQNCDFPSFGFVVTRDNGKSTSSWSGQCHLCDGQEVLYTTWTNTQRVNTCSEIKRATSIGQDKWTRYRQSQAPREEA